MVNLPKLPARMARLPKDARGYPVPWFVHWRDDGTPDFRVVGKGKMEHALRFAACWVCGEQMGRYGAFVIGPMCAVNRNSAEPPCHQDCAEFSALACPFLTKPKMKRNEKDLPEQGVTAGIAIMRNPGAAGVWTSRTWKPYKCPLSGGVLFDLGDPYEVKWFAFGRQASREEVQASIDSGLPILQEVASKEGPDALAHLEAMVQRTLPLLPPPAEVSP